MRTAILVDGGFFLKRYRAIFPDWPKRKPATVAKEMHSGLLKHLNQKPQKSQLYRILYYDCPPMTNYVRNPVTGRGVNLAKTAEAQFRLAFFNELKRHRKVALRLGHLSRNSQWRLKSDNIKRLFRKDVTVDELTESDVEHVSIQKGVDMKLGLDIASLSYKRLVEQIVLVLGDSDFVPAAKLARREGIDVVLDPMWNHINPDLYEHIDGLHSPWPRPSGRCHEP